MSTVPQSNCTLESQSQIPSQKPRMQWSGAPVYGVFYCDFGFDSQEWSCSHGNNSTPASQFTLLYQSSSDMFTQAMYGRFAQTQKRRICVPQTIDYGVVDREFDSLTLKSGCALTHSYLGSCLRRKMTNISCPRISSRTFTGKPKYTPPPTASPRASCSHPVFGSDKNDSVRVRSSFPMAAGVLQSRQARSDQDRCPAGPRFHVDKGSPTLPQIHRQKCPHFSDPAATRALLFHPLSGRMTTGIEAAIRTLFA